MTTEQITDLLIQLVPSISVLIGFLVSAITLILKVKAAFSENKISDLQETIKESQCNHDEEIKELKEQNELLIQNNNRLIETLDELTQQLSKVKKV